MFDFDNITATSAPRPILPGAHCEIAERYRQAALHSSAKLRVMSELVDVYLREHCDDDLGQDEALGQVVKALQECAAWIAAFRATRIIDGEA